MSTMDERELFSNRYEQVDPDRLFGPVKRALATMALRDADDTRRTARFESGVSLTSWGENLLAEVTPDAVGGSKLTVHGRPEGSFLTTRWGEDVHARGVEKQLRKAVEDALAAAPRAS